MSSDNLPSDQRSDTYPVQEYSTKPEKSWRTLTFFKNSGLMIRFELSKQCVYFSFIDKTSSNSYQSFNNGFVIKLDFFALNELLFCLTFPEPAQWESWREKSAVKYLVVVSPFKLQSFNLTSRISIVRVSYALKLAVFSNK